MASAAPMATTTTPVASTAKGEGDRGTISVAVIRITAAVISAVTGIAIIVVGIVPIARAVPMSVVPPTPATAIVNRLYI